MSAAEKQQKGRLKTAERQPKSGRIAEEHQKEAPECCRKATEGQHKSNRRADSNRIPDSFNIALGKGVPNRPQWGIWFPVGSAVSCGAGMSAAEKQQKSRLKTAERQPKGGRMLHEGNRRAA